MLDEMLKYHESPQDDSFVTGANVLPVSVALVALVAFMAWLFQDEVAAAG